MLLGARAHDFGKASPEELAERIAAKGFACVQLAPAKAVAGLGAGRLSKELARRIGGAFTSRGLEIAVLGCYVNLIHPDPAERARLLELFQEHLRLARDFGAGLVGTETGSVNADYSFHPANHGEDAFRTLLDSVAELAAEADKQGMLMGIEGVAGHTIFSPARMRRLLDMVKSDSLRVIFDPFNLITEKNWENQGAMLEESFGLFGDKIAAVHAKDFVIAGGIKQKVPVGRGRLDYALLFRLLREHKPGIPVLLEDAEPETMLGSAEFLRRVWEEA